MSIFYTFQSVALQADSQANDLAGRAEGKANELAGKAKGQYAEMKGDAKEAVGDIKNKFKQTFPSQVVNRIVGKDVQQTYIRPHCVVILKFHIVHLYKLFSLLSS